MNMQANNEKVYEGHRNRLRQRFLQNGLNGFGDYEIIELLLILGTPRKDCKQIAKKAVEKFNGLVGVLSAKSEELQQVKGIGPMNVFGIILIQAVFERYAKEKITPGNFLDSPLQLFNYLKEKIGKEKKEYFSILYLDTRNNLIVEDVSVGILNASLVHPREVFKKAVLNNTSHVVIAHNHPSGDPSPSLDDIETTKRLIAAGNIWGISVEDHLIVTRERFVSLKEMGYFN